MPVLKLKLIDRYELCHGTYAFEFEKPAGLTFKPGQYGGFTLINPRETDASGITRRFSFMSAPDENVLTFATRIQQSAYKRMLNELPLGAEIKFAGPTGNFTLHDDIYIPAVFIAGGIGITPFYSMLKHHQLHPTSQTLYLFYGNRSVKDAPLLQDITNMANINDNFTFVPTMEQVEQDWTGETGFISDQMIKKYVKDIYEPIYYVCGSPAMVTCLQELLAEMGIDEDKIKVEDFPGY